MDLRLEHEEAPRIPEKGAPTHLSVLSAAVASQALACKTNFCHTFMRDFAALWLTSSITVAQRSPTQNPELSST